MRGNNIKRGAVKGDGNQLDIVNIQPTIQSEGPFAGTPAIFIRLGGCNLACDFCDTEFEQFTRMTLQSILQEVQRTTTKETLTVVTGGEPLRQPIEKLCTELLEADYQVQIETNGTLFRPLDERVHIVCSPKNVNGGYHRLREDLLPRLNAIKFIISKTHPQYTHVQEVGQSAHHTPVYVQPMDEFDEAKNTANRHYAVELAHRHNYKLSLQWHKALGLP